MKPREIYKLIQDDLDRVEREIERQSGSNVQLIDHVSRYVRDGGGKRVRPSLLLLSARMCGFEGEICYRLGAVVELIHAATLVHDDIIDDAGIRRGRASVNAHWGNEITVLMGDWLYMTSFYMALQERRFKILDILTDVTRKMIEGELIQLSLNGNLDITEEQHLDISRRKTAFLFSACTQIGGILGGTSAELEECLRLYGLHIGLAFQMADDVLDFTSTESILGKPVGSDLKEGKITLPLIYLMREGGAQLRRLIANVMQPGVSAAEQRETVMKLVRERGTVDRVLEKARRYAAQARGYLEGFPPSSAREALMSLPDFIVERER